MAENGTDTIFNEISGMRTDDSGLPYWANVIMSCFKGVMLEVKTLNTRNKRIQKLEKIKEIQLNVNNNLENENTKLKEELLELKFLYGKQEQRSNNYVSLLHFLSVIMIILTVITSVDVFLQMYWNSPALVLPPSLGLLSQSSDMQNYLAMYNQLGNITYQTLASNVFGTLITKKQI